jgi:hypothetical protein
LKAGGDSRCCAKEDFAAGWATARGKEQTEFQNIAHKLHRTLQSVAKRCTALPRRQRWTRFSVLARFGFCFDKLGGRSVLCGSDRVRDSEIGWIVLALRPGKPLMATFL